MTSRAEDAWYDEQAGPLVPLYAVTGGRSGAGDQEFTVSTLVRRSTGRPGGADDTGRSAEEAAILRLCGRALSVAEVAAYLSLPLGTVAALLADLRRAGLIETPQDEAEHPPADVMRRLRDGLLTL